MALRLDMIALLAASTLTVMSGAAISPALPGMAQHFAEVPEAGGAGRREAHPSAALDSHRLLLLPLVLRLGPRSAFPVSTTGGNKSSLIFRADLQTFYNEFSNLSK